jgi:hypothetical protein
VSDTDLCPTCGGDCGTSECENTCSAHGLASCQACPPGSPPRACGCPEQDGRIYHQRETCTDPLVARLDWYGTLPPPPGDLSGGDWDDEPCSHVCEDDGCEDEWGFSACTHSHCGNCGGCGCPGYCDDHRTYNLRPAETGGSADA